MILSRRVVHFSTEIRAMGKEPSYQELYGLYLAWREDFLKADPTIPRYFPPLLEGFELIMKHMKQLDENPEETRRPMGHFKSDYPALEMMMIGLFRIHLQAPTPR